MQEQLQKAANSLQPHSKMLVKNHNVINLVLCQDCDSQSHWTIRLIAREECLHCPSDVCIIQDDLCIKPHHHHTTTVLRPFFRDHPGETVPKEKFWTSWCKVRLTEADTLTIRLGTTPSGLTSAHLHHPPYFLQAGCPSCHPTNSVKPLKARPMHKAWERNDYLLQNGCHEDD